MLAGFGVSGFILCASLWGFVFSVDAAWTFKQCGKTSHWLGDKPIIACVCVCVCVCVFDEALLSRAVEEAYSSHLLASRLGPVDSVSYLLQ